MVSPAVMAARCAGGCGSLVRPRRVLCAVCDATVAVATVRPGVAPTVVLPPLEQAPTERLPRVARGPWGVR